MSKFKKNLSNVFSFKNFKKLGFKNIFIFSVIVFSVFMGLNKVSADTLEVVGSVESYRPTITITRNDDSSNLYLNIAHILPSSNCRF